MPEINIIGWVHIIIGVLALTSGFYCLIVYKKIAEKKVVGKFYLVSTLFTAATSLLIYQQGVFGPAHVLAVLTFLSLAIGYSIQFVPPFSRSSPYIQNFCYSITVLFHMIPTITEGLLRLPVNKPIVTDQSDPLLGTVHGLLLVVFIVCYICQYFWLRRHLNQAK